MARLYADENFPGPICDALRTFGHDVLTAHQAGQANQYIPDPQVLAFAIAQGRAVLTRDRWHFVRLHTRVRPHHGIIVCSEDTDYPAQAQKIHYALSQCPMLDNQLLRIHKS
jgi:hypothetical protein